MKAVVLEIREQEAAVLDHDGIFRKIKNKNYSVGQVLELDSEELLPGSQSHVFRVSSSFRRKATAACAAAAIAVLGTGGGIAASSFPVSSVTVEMDSPLTYKLNLFDRVLSVEGMENDPSGQKELLSQVKGKRMDKAMELTLDLFLQEGFIEDSDKQVNVTVDTHFGKEPRLENMVDGGIETWNQKKKPRKSGNIHRITDGHRQEGLSEAYEPADTRTAPEGFSGQEQVPLGESFHETDLPERFPEEGLEAQSPDPHTQANQPGRQDKLFEWQGNRPDKHDHQHMLPENQTDEPGHQHMLPENQTDGNDNPSMVQEEPPALPSAPDQPDGQTAAESYSSDFPGQIQNLSQTGAQPEIPPDGFPVATENQFITEDMPPAIPETLAGGSMAMEHPRI
ncbi:MAG: anti-sigma factor domain-containing protein [Blautia sp.]|nr:anti-sigma factor domain-containing protein [Blautia sp.]